MIQATRPPALRTTSGGGEAGGGRHAGVRPGAMSGLSVYRSNLLKNTANGFLFLFCSFNNNAYKISLFDIVNSFLPTSWRRIGMFALFCLPTAERF